MSASRQTCIIVYIAYFSLVIEFVVIQPYVTVYTQYAEFLRENSGGENCNQTVTKIDILF